MNVDEKTKIFLEKSADVHGCKYDYSKCEYKHSKTKIRILCKTHGEFMQIPGIHLKGHGCPSCAGTKPLDLKTFITRAISIHNSRFDYSKIHRFNGTTTNIPIGCRIHGIFLQTPFHHMQGQGCPKCAKDKIARINNERARQSFISKASLVHIDRYTYSNVVYINSKTRVVINCKQHGNFLQQPRSHLSGDGCPSCAYSSGERIIENFLIENNIDYSTQYKIGGYKYRYDFFIPEKRILLEYDGKQHTEFVPYFHIDEEKFIRQKERDQAKNKLAKEKGFFLYRISYIDVDVANTLKRICI